MWPVDFTSASASGGGENKSPLIPHNGLGDIRVWAADRANLMKIVAVRTIVNRLRSFTIARSVDRILLPSTESQTAVLRAELHRRSIEQMRNMFMQGFSGDLEAAHAKATQLAG
ncbi:ABC-type xenobiotic transporter [Sarracenia purpurea var. burkii]